MKQFFYKLEQVIKTRNYASLLLIVIFFIFTAVILYSLRDHYFTNDDFYYLGRAEQAIEKPVSIFYPSYLSRIHPVFITILSFQYALFDVSPFGYYFVLIILHLLNTFLLYRIFTKIDYNKRVVFWGTLFFLVSSLHFQAVTWITCQSTVLSTTFFLSGILVFINYKMSNNKTNLSLLILLYSFAILTFENSVTLPLVLLVYDFTFCRNSLSKNKKNILIYLVLIVITLSFTFITFKLGGMKAHSLSLDKHVLLNMFGFPREVLHAFLIPRSEFVDFIPISTIITRILPYLFLFTLTFIIMFGNRGLVVDFWIKNKKLITFLILWIFVTIFPAVLRPMEGGFWQVRYLYIPLIGTYIFVGMFIHLLYSCINYKRQKRVILRFLLTVFIISSVFLNIKTLIFLSDKRYQESKWSEPKGQKAMVLSVIPQLRQIYPKLPDSSTVLLENMPVSGIPLRAIMNFYYQEDLKIIEIEDISREKTEVKKPYYYFKLIDGKIVNYSKVE